MEKGKRVDTPRKMGKVYKNKQHKTGFPRAVLQSSPTRGMWIEIGDGMPPPMITASSPTRGMLIEMACVAEYAELISSSPTRGMWIEIRVSSAGALAVAVIPHTGDVD